MLKKFIFVESKVRKLNCFAIKHYFCNKDFDRYLKESNLTS